MLNFLNTTNFFKRKLCKWDVLEKGFTESDIVSSQGAGEPRNPAMRPWTVPGRKMPPPACRRPIDILPNLMLMLKFFIKLHKNNCEKQQHFFLSSLFSNIENCDENKTVRKTHLKCIKFELMNFRGRGTGTSGQAATAAGSECEGAGQGRQVMNWDEVSRGRSVI